MAARVMDDVFDALDEQTVVVPGIGTLDVVIPSLVRSLAAVHEQRRALEAQFDELLEAHPLSQVLTSLPGVGVRTAAVLPVTVGDGTSFPTAAHLASYVGLASATKQSGTSIREGSSRIRIRVIVCMARLSCRSPLRLRRCRLVSPDDAGISETGEGGGGGFWAESSLVRPADQDLGGGDGPTPSKPRNSRACCRTRVRISFSRSRPWPADPGCAGPWTAWLAPSSGARCPGPGGRRN